MDGGTTTRTAPAPSAAPVRSDSIPARPIAPTESPPEKVVQPVGETSSVRLDVAPNSQRLAEAFQAVDRQQSFDKEAGRVVVSWVDHDTGELVNQFPTEQMLKLRAYWRDKLRDADLTRAQGGSDITV